MEHAVPYSRMSALTSSSFKDLLKWECVCMCGEREIYMYKKWNTYIYIHTYVCIHIYEGKRERGKYMYKWIRNETIYIHIYKEGEKEFYIHTWIKKMKLQQ